MFEFVEFSVVIFHALELIISRPDPCGSWEAVVFSEGANLWDIWESIEVLLSSGEVNVRSEVTGDGLSPSGGSLPGA